MIWLYWRTRVARWSSTREQRLFAEGIAFVFFSSVWLNPLERSEKEGKKSIRWDIRDRRSCFFIDLKPFQVFPIFFYLLFGLFGRI